MIPESFIEQWQRNVPWQTLPMVEQDLIISRALLCPGIEGGRFLCKLGVVYR